MKKSYTLISDVQNENLDLTRRLYKTIIDVVRQLDKQRSHVETCSDLFTPQVEILRCKLRESCERLIFCDPTSYGRKAEEILWRKAFYDVVSAAKRLHNGGPWSKNDEAFLSLHITCGLGFYHHLLLRLQSEFHLQYSGLVDFPLLTLDHAKTTLTAKSVKWAEESAQRCLISLGDLCRYKTELKLNSTPANQSLASRYYYQAIWLKPDVGMPHNQLGTLSGLTNFGIDAVYHFMRSIICPHPFDGAEGNMSRAIDNVMKKSMDYQCIGNLEAPVNVFHRFAKQLLIVAEAWFWGNSTQIFSENVIEDFEKSVEVGLLDSDTLVKVLGILIMCHDRQKQKPIKLSAVPTAIVAILKYMVRHALQYLVSCPGGLDDKTATKLTRQRKSRRRRRRRRLCPGESSDDSELSESGEAVNSDLSVSEASDDENNEVVSESSSDSSDDELKINRGGEHVKGTAPPLIDKQQAPESGRGDGDHGALALALALLAPIKVGAEWLNINADLTSAISQDDLKSDLEKLADRLDAMTLAAPVPCNESPVPLPEDVQFKGLNIFASIHDLLDWSAWKHTRLHGDAETVLRAARVSAVCRELVSLLGKLPSLDSPPKNGLKKGPSKGQLMQSMGQLWLRAEVRALESRVGRNNGAETLSPYLVLDADALTEHALLVRQLVSARRFIVLVPSAVLSALDRMKRESAKAREAIRWLEEQLQLGSPFLRAQRVGESLPLPLKYPRRKERDAWLFFQVMECCHYLSQRGGSEGSMVTLLTGTSMGTPGAVPSAHFSPVGVSKAIGVNLEHVETFFSKWKNSTKSHG